MVSRLHRRRDARRVRDDADAGKCSGQQQARRQKRPGRQLAAAQRFHVWHHPYLLWTGRRRSQARSTLEHHESFGAHMQAASAMGWIQRPLRRLGRGVHDGRLLRLRAQRVLHATRHDRSRRAARTCGSRRTPRTAREHRTDRRDRTAGVQRCAGCGRTSRSGRQAGCGGARRSDWSAGSSRRAGRKGRSRIGRR